MKLESKFVRDGSIEEGPAPQWLDLSRCKLWSVKVCCSTPECEASAEVGLRYTRLASVFGVTHDFLDFHLLSEAKWSMDAALEGFSEEEAREACAQQGFVALPLDGLKFLCPSCSRAKVSTTGDVIEVEGQVVEDGEATHEEP